MNKYRSAALVLVTCAAGLSLAACSAGITTASPATSTSAASRPAAARSSSGTASSSVNTVALGGSIGSFPIPAGAKVVENISVDKQIEVVIGSVSPQKAASFYSSALPRAGYKITMNGLSSSGNSSTLGIEFTGHGYKGDITAASNLSGVSLPSSGGKYFLAIIFSKN
jgi:hypothetical protein